MTEEKRKKGQGEADPAKGGGQGGEEEKEGSLGIYLRHGRTPPTPERLAAYTSRTFSNEVLNTFYYNLDDHANKRRNVFMGILLGHMGKFIEEDDKKVPTACVSQSGDIILGRMFVAGQEVDEVRWTLAHEVLHWANRHFSRARKILREKYGVKSVWDIEESILKVELDLFNLAEDCSINQLLDGREEHGFKRPFGKDFGVSLEGLNKGFGLNMPPNLEMESYYYSLVNTPQSQRALAGAQDEADKIKSMLREAQHDSGAQKGNGGKGEGGEEAGDRMGDIKTSGKVGEAAERQQFDDAMRGRSDNPFMSAIAAMLPKIDKSLKDREIWKSMVFALFGEHRSDQWRNSMIRPNRRNADNPYSRTPIRRSLHSVVIIDTSGSVLDDIPFFMGAIQRAAEAYGASVDLVFCTTDVYAVHKGIKRPAHYIKSGKIELATGGTDLTEAQKYVAANYKSRRTNVVVLTDGETPWLDWDFNTAVIYTHQHQKIPGVKKFAVLGGEAR